MKMNETDYQLHLLGYEFERRFDERVAIKWMQENWNKSFLFCGLYVVTIFGIQHYMRERQKWDLRRPFVLWSLALAIFSTISTVRTGWGMLHILNANGFKQSVCNQSLYRAPVIKFWGYACIFSKVLLLGDTIFIVLQKQRLVFAHWYHHISVLLYTWFAYKDQVAGGNWFMIMSYLCNSLVYSNYTLRAAGVRVPRPYVIIIILIFQIAQMVMGLTVNGLVYMWMQEGHCPSYLEHIMCSSVVYLSNLLLLPSFFHSSLKGFWGKGSKEE